MQMSKGKERETHAEVLVIRALLGWLRQKKAVLSAGFLHQGGSHGSGLNKGFGTSPAPRLAALTPCCVTVGKPRNLSNPQMLGLEVAL